MKTLRGALSIPRYAMPLNAHTFGTLNSRRHFSVASSMAVESATFPFRALRYRTRQASSRTIPAESVASGGKASRSVLSYTSNIWGILGPWYGHAKNKHDTTKFTLPSKLEDARYCGVLLCYSALHSVVKRSLSNTVEGIC